MVKGVIPHGLISRIWKAHNQLLDIRAAAADRLKGSVRPGLIDARAIKQETEKSIRQRVAAYRAAAEDLGKGIQQTASKLCCMARREMREVRSQVTFANPLVTGIQTVRKDVQQGILNLRQLVAKNRKEVRSQRQRPILLQVTTRSAKDAELPVEEAEVEYSDEATEAPDCVPLLPVESSAGVPELEPMESEPTQLRPDVPEKEVPPGEVALWARFIAGAKPGIMVDYGQLRPSELLFADKIELIEAVNSKRKHGERFREMAIQEAWNKRGHKVPVSSDRCGSMTYLQDAALDLGIDHWLIPPYSPRFNLTEQAIGILNLPSRRAYLEQAQMTGR